MAGEPLTVECSVEAYPAASIEWLSGQSALVPGHGVTLAYDGECATLKFAQVAPAHTGRYSCVARWVNLF
jgi:hypothetical protein